jgi:hypothetical protein
MARLSRNNENRSIKRKKDINWLLLLNLLATAGLYMLHFIGI